MSNNSNQMNENSDNLSKEIKDMDTNTCDLCERNFPTLSTLEIHMEEDHVRSVREKRSHCCDQCKATFKWKSDLENHKKAKHLGLKLTCEQCGDFTTHDRTSMRYHLLTHRGVRDHVR